MSGANFKMMEEFGSTLAVLGEEVNAKYGFMEWSGETVIPLKIDLSTPCTSMSAQQLPQELVDQIVDHFRSDFSALKSLGHISRPWSQRTRQHLFQRARLTNSTSCMTLKEIIAGRLVLSQYIQEVEIRHEDRYQCPLYDRTPHLSDALALLPAITKLFLNGTGDFIEWNRVPGVLRDTLYGVMKRARIVELTNVYNFEIIPLAQCQALKELSLHRVYLLPSRFRQSGYPSHSQSLPRRLHRLTVGDCCEALKELLMRQPFATIDLCHPTELTVHAFAFDEEMALALELCGSAVESYHVLALTNKRQSPDPFPDAIFDFSRTRRLKHLRIDIAHHHCWVQHDSDVLISAVEGLEKVSSPSDLETITILHGFAPPPTSSEFSTAIDVNLAAIDEGWSQLDSVLSRDAFGRLQSVLLVFDISSANGTQHEGGWNWAQDQVIDRMPKMSGRGILHVTRSVSYLSSHVSLTDTLRRLRNSAV